MRLDPVGAEPKKWITYSNACCSLAKCPIWDSRLSPFGNRVKVRRMEDGELHEVRRLCHQRLKLALNKHRRDINNVNEQVLLSSLRHL